MADLQPTDTLLVNRAGTSYKIAKSDLMATVLDSDLLIVNRQGVDYKATYADVKKGFGPGDGITPAPEDWTFSPAIQGGSGTQANPFIITPATLYVPGSSTESEQTLSLTGLEPNKLVIWTDNSVGAGERFAQNLYVVPPSGSVDLKLRYVDTPATATDETYQGDLQIGTSYFRWQVNQVAGIQPELTSVTLSLAAGPERFTNQSFPVSAALSEDGFPLSDKKLKAWVEGELKLPPVTSAITNVAEVTGGAAFATTTYTGDGNQRSITNGLDLAGTGGLVWTKNRTTSGDNSHCLTDTVRGVSKQLFTNSTSSEGAASNRINGFNADGFDLGNSPMVNQTSTNYVAWSFLKSAGFFDVVTYTGTGNLQEIPHNLGSVPGCIITKNVTNGSDWVVYHKGVGPTGALRLNLTGVTSNSISWWNNTEPTSSVFTVNTNDSNNAAGETFVAYIFADDPSNQISCGVYTCQNGNTYPENINPGAANSASNPFKITTGFRPKWLLTRNVTAGGRWTIFDQARGSFYETYPGGQPVKYLQAHKSDDEFNDVGPAVYADGFGVGDNTTDFNNGTCVYIAIGEPVSAFTELTLTDATDLEKFDAGDAITEVGGDASGSVGAVDIPNLKMTVAGSSGTWDVGSQVQGPPKTVYVEPESDVITAISDQVASWTETTSPSVYSNKPWLGMAYGADDQGTSYFGAFNDIGEWIRSTDGITWQRRTELGYQVNRVRYANGIWVAAGEGSQKMLYSNDANTWSTSSAGSAPMNDVNYGNGLWVAVGNSSALYTSPDGQNWTSKTANATGTGLAIAYGNGVWIGGFYLDACHSIDGGNTWVKNSALPAVVGTPREIYYNGSLFVCVGDGGKIASSTDGLTWTDRSNVAFAGNLRCVLYANGLWIAAAENDYLTSFDGITWTKPSGNLGTSNAITSMAYGNGTWTTGSVQDNLTYSTTPISGTVLTLASDKELAKFDPGDAVHQDSDYSPQTSEITGYTTTNGNLNSWTQKFNSMPDAANSIAYGNGAFVGVGSQHGVVYSTNDGDSFSTYILENDSTYTLRTVLFHEGNFYALNSNGYIYKSPTGAQSSWTLITACPVTSITGAFVMVGDSIYLGCQNDGIFWGKNYGETWQQVKPGTPWQSDNARVQGLAYGNGVFVAQYNLSSSNASALAYSTDGTSYTQSVAMGNGSSYHMAFVNGHFLGQRSSTQFQVSADGINWSTPNCPTGLTIYQQGGVSDAGNGQTLIIGGTNKACVTTNFSNFTSLTFGTDNRGVNAAHRNPTTGTIMAVGDGGGGNPCILLRAQGNQQYLTLADSTGLDAIAAGDAISQSDAAATAVAQLVDAGSNRIYLTDSTGTWTANSGKTVIGPSVAGGTGTVGSVDPAGPTITLSATSNTWVANAGKYVVGPVKPASSIRLYCKLDATGAVSDLLGSDPGYTAWTPAGTTPGPYTGNITFPAVLPTGNAPDTDLPEGTELVCSVEASNGRGSSAKTSNTVIPTSLAKAVAGGADEYDKIVVSFTTYDPRKAQHKADVVNALTQAGLDPASVKAALDAS